MLQRIGWERGGPTDPYCVLDSASGNYYIKTGGERSVTCGWDGGAAKDKCCRTAMGPDGRYIESFRRRFVYSVWAVTNEIYSAASERLHGPWLLQEQARKLPMA